MNELIKKRSYCLVLMQESIEDAKRLYFQNKYWRWLVELSVYEYEQEKNYWDELIINHHENEGIA